MAFRIFALLMSLGIGALTIQAQNTPRPAAAEQRFEVLGLSVEGAASPEIAEFVKQRSALRVGQTLTIPGDPALADAVRGIYALQMFSDVKVAVERTLGNGAYLVIRVREEPKLNEYQFLGVPKKHRDDLRKEVAMTRSSTVRPADVERAKLAIREFYKTKGYLMTSVDVQRRTDTTANTINLDFVVNRGPKVEVEDIKIEGNQKISDRSIRKRMKSTKEDHWWRIFSATTFKKDKYDEDLQNVLNLYNEKGFYDARIVKDTVYLREGDDPGVVVELSMHEGPRYHIRNVTWEGNTVYPDEALTQSLGIDEGDVYNSKRLEENLYGNKRSSDVSSMYTNRGYMKFYTAPQVTVVPGDSLDIAFDVYEGDIYTFGRIDISGNDKTKEHVIRRELYTIPGETFSRESLQESIRRLGQLNYFNQESLATGITTDIDEADKVVNLGYKLEEVGSDNLELSGTWGRFGLVLMLRFGFNNFSVQNFFDKSAWRPLPSGDGQKLSLGVQTNGRYYQNYSMSFTEPWFRGRPTPIGFSLSHSRLSDISRYYYYSADTLDTDRKFINSSARVFLDRRLKWPDDYFGASTSLGYQFYNNRLYSTLPQGISQEFTIRQSLSRSSLDNPMFPQRGSQFELSVQVAAPLPDFIQYHKWRFTSQWNVPILPKLSLGVGTDLGYIGSLTGDKVQFERFDVGGSPFETQGYYVYGSDIVYMRGYPRSAIGPKSGGAAVGGTILNKYTSDLRWIAIQTPQLSVAPYLFADAANTWPGFENWNPSQLYRSAGLGAKVFLPILGMVELTYGYNFDEFEAVTSDHQGNRRWYFQFTLGQGFGN